MDQKPWPEAALIQPHDPRSQPDPARNTLNWLKYSNKGSSQSPIHPIYPIYPTHTLTFSQPTLTQSTYFHPPSHHPPTSHYRPTSTLSTSFLSTFPYSFSYSYISLTYNWPLVWKMSRASVIRFDIDFSPSRTHTLGSKYFLLGLSSPSGLPTGVIK